MVCLLAPAWPAAAQQTSGNIIGRVVDSQGAAVAGAAVTARKADTGFMKVISESVAPCRVIDSTSLVGDLPRKKDKIHPNEEGREVWAEAVFGWLSHELQASGERPWTLKPR